ncbi:MAG: RNA polymerase sigma-I factor [Clostridia bacterium]|nr:RNA polymerase sigma-I factor [Clostridia bacterium]
MDFHDLHLQAKENPEAREKLIQVSKKQIARLASGVAGRPLAWENDDELSIGLIAFNEAIDTFDPTKGKSFWGYAGLVIRHRLMDYFRKEVNWQKKVPFTGEDESINPEVLQKEAELAWEAMRREEEARDRAETVVAFEQRLLQYGISLKELTKNSPKHRDTRETLIKAAVALTRQQELLKRLLVTKQLPIKELMVLTGQSRKVLERGRRYLIALVLILSQPEFRLLGEFLQLPEEVRVWPDKEL